MPVHPDTSRASRLRALSCLIAFAAVPAAAEDPPRPPVLRPLLGDPYTHPFAGFTFKPPLEWRAGETVEGAVASFYGPKDKFFVPRLDVVHVRLKGGAAPEDFLRNWKADQAKSQPGWAAAEEGPMVVNGVLGTRLVSTIGGRDAPLKNITYVLPEAGRVFVLSFTTGRGYYERYLPTIEKSVQTFRILPEANLDEARKKTFFQHYNAAFDHVKAGRKEEAVREFAEASAILPAFADLHRARAGLCAELGRTEEAVAEYRRVVELDPGNADAHFNLGTLLAGQGEKPEAETLFRKAVALDTSHGPAQVNLGVMLAAREAWADARKALEKGCVLMPESVPAHLTLGRVYEKLNESKRALREYRDVLVLEPGNAEAATGVKRLGDR